MSQCERSLICARPAS